MHALSSIHDPADEAPLVITPPEAPRTRRKRVASIEIPEELHALAVLTGRDPAEMIMDLMAAQLIEVKRRASAILTEAAR